MLPREWRRARDFRASSCLPLIMSHLDNQLPMSAVRRLWGVPWRFGEQECQADKWDSGEHLQSQLDLSAQFGDSDKSTHRNPPFDLSAGSSFGTAVSYPSSDESSDTNEQLEGSGESPTVGRMGCGSELLQQPGRRHTDFRLVNWRISIVLVRRLLRELTRCKYTKETDTHTSKESARQHRASVLACCL
jgi:hypothetical protein